MHANEHLHLQIARARHSEDLRKAEQMRLLGEDRPKPAAAPLALMLVAISLVASRLNQ